MPDRTSLSNLGRLPSSSHSGASHGRPARWLEAAAVALVLFLHGWLALSAAATKGVAVDEMPHLMGGYGLWTRGDYRLQPENGVLPQLWETIPAVFTHPNLPPADSTGWSQPNVWTLGHEYFHQCGNDLAELLRHGRCMNVFWSLGTGLLVYLWTRRLFGWKGAWIALLFWAFCPTFLAHGALATSDMCMTFFMLAAVGAYWVQLQREGAPWTWLSAVTFGLACVAKFSVVLLPLMYAAMAAVWVFTPMASPSGTSLWKRSRLVLASAVVHVAVAVAVIWAFHCFRFLPGVDPGLVNDYTRPWNTVLASLGGTLATTIQQVRTLHLLPDAYLYGFAFVLDLSQSRGSFLNGEIGLTGWVEFFPYAFLVKTSPALLVALALCAWIAVRRASMAGMSSLRGALGRITPLLVLLVVYWAFSLTSNLNIGHRHLLPTYPVLFILVGSLGSLAATGVVRWIGIVALLCSHIAASVQIRPDYLAYFNRLAGGPSEGYRHLVDSSLDWGQDLPGLSRWLQSHSNGEQTYLAYFGTDDPKYYEIKAVPMVPLLRNIPGRPWYALTPGMYCVSATLLEQAYSPIRTAWSPILENEYQKLRALEPAMLDYSAHPERRREWEVAASASKWEQMWQRYEQLRFSRLCYLLRARTPDAQIGYSINIYRLSADDAAAATGRFSEWRDAVQASETARLRGAK